MKSFVGDTMCFPAPASEAFGTLVSVLLSWAWFQMCCTRVGNRISSLEPYSSTFSEEEAIYNRKLWGVTILSGATIGNIYSYFLFFFSLLLHSLGGLKQIGDCKIGTDTRSKAEISLNHLQNPVSHCIPSFIHLFWSTAT